MQDPKKLKVYQSAKELSKKVYLALDKLPDYNRIKGQITGSTTSLCTNLGEMAAFDNVKSQIQKVVTCIGETNETEFWLDFCKDVGHISEEQYKAFLNTNKMIRMQLMNLLRSIERIKNQ